MTRAQASHDELAGSPEARLVAPSGGHPSAVPRVLLAADVDRCALDAFDLWTLFETLPRAARRDLVGDLGAVRRHVVDELPALTPVAITSVDDDPGAAGIRGYRAEVHVRERAARRCTVTLALDDIADGRAAMRAAADLARFVEYVLTETLDDTLDLLLEQGRPSELRPDATC